jgi:SAM-dependent methyltransferase
MNLTDKQAIIERYEKRFAEFGEDIRTLASGTKERQLTRFNVMREMGIEPGSSVLDLGCGFADFYAFLQDQGVEVDYTGYDISPAFIATASKKFPEANFKVCDIQDDEDTRKFDYIVCSQVFNNSLAHEDMGDVAKDVLSLCYDRMNKGMAFDFISSHVDYRRDGLHYHSPEQVFSFCKGLSKRVCLRHDYPLFEFTVYVYPDFQGWRRKS